MADNYLITGYLGQPHVTAENDRGIHAGIFGAGRYVLPVGKKFKAEYIGNNTIRMYDGKLMDNGAAAGIPAGEYVDILISNASQGMNRNDLIVFQYSQDASTLIEKGEFIVIQGIETNGTAADPAITQADLLTGNATLEQFPLWRVSVSGVAISAPVKLFAEAKTIPDKADSGHSHALTSGNITGVLPVTKGGTGADNAAKARENLGITPANIGALAKTGDTITGAFRVHTSVDPYVEFKNTGAGGSGAVGLRDADDGAYMFMRQCSETEDGTVTGFYEQFKTPTATKGRTANAFFEFLTTKTPVPVANGGTGATNAAKARENLGITPANIGALPITGGAVNNGSITLEGSDWMCYRITRASNGASYEFETSVSGSGHADITIKHNGTPVNSINLAPDSTNFAKPVPIGSGGTGATNVADARKNLGFTFSETEQETGDTWIDGKPIYRKAVEINVTNTGSPATVATFPEAINMINLSGYVIRGGGIYRFPVSWYGGESNFHTIWMENTTTLSARTTAAITGYVIIEYTK